jgi:glycosyltransferase involved in cell wall biosynthesis
MKILAISHESSATGAPIFFETLLSWFKKSGHDIEIVVLKDGVIRSQFERLGRTLFLSDLTPNSRDSALREFFSGKDYEAIYLNTLETSHVLSFLVEESLVPDHVLVISHIHELEGTIQKYGPQRIGILNSRANLIFCVSNAVRDNLVHHHSFSPEKIKVVNPCSRKLISADFAGSDANWFQERADHSVILGCGEISVGKGVDAFINAAVSLRRIYRERGVMENFSFVWLGPDSYSIKSYFDRDIEILGLTDAVRIFTHRDNVQPFFSKSDFFFMCSRQDSFPLVCLEAASLKKPIVYFPDAGGIKEFLGSDAGFPLAYLDSQGAANLFWKMISGEVDYSGAVELAHSRWAESYSAEKICGKVEKIMAELGSVRACVRDEGKC